MKKETILKKAIEKAITNSFNPVPDWLIQSGLCCDEDGNVSVDERITDSYYRLIFSHDFAKAFWGEDWLCYDCGGRVDHYWARCSCARQFEENEPAWQYHLQQMVLKKDPIKYLKEFI